MKTTLVQIDGSNFYNKVKTLTPAVHLTEFNYSGLIREVCDSDCRQVYYVGEVKKYPGNRKSQDLYSNQQSLFRNLRKQGFELKLGYLLQSGGVFHEKGVDVQMAVDLVRGAIKNEYGVVYLLSSDTDLIPAIKTAMEAGKEVVYVGFEGLVSRALSRNCSSSLILKKEVLLKFK